MHWNNFMGSSSFGLEYAGISGSVLFLALVWSLIWKGLALWKAAQKGSKRWFVALLVINTLGILEILYFYVFGKKCCCTSEKCCELCEKKEKEKEKKHNNKK